MPTSEPAPWARRSLPRDACLGLLGPGGRGRVAATMRAVPIIVPVVFELVGDDVVFRTGPDADIARAVTDAVVAFETDDLGPTQDPVWGVHVTGVARPIHSEGAPATFRLYSEIVSGWQIGV